MVPEIDTGEVTASGPVPAARVKPCVGVVIVPADGPLYTRLAARFGGLIKPSGTYNLWIDETGLYLIDLVAEVEIAVSPWAG